MIQTEKKPTFSQFPFNSMLTFVAEQTLVNNGITASYQLYKAGNFTLITITYTGTATGAVSINFNIEGASNPKYTVKQTIFNGANAAVGAIQALTDGTLAINVINTAVLTNVAGTVISYFDIDQDIT